MPMQTRRTILTALLALVPVPAVRAQEPPIPALLAQLRDETTSQAAVTQLIARGAAAIPHLAGEANEGPSLAARGWSIVALVEIGGDRARTCLDEIRVDNKLPALVRTWAAAGRVKTSRTIGEVEQNLGLVQEFPALGRPLGLQLLKVARAGGGGGMEAMLLLAQRYPQMQASVGQAILGGGPEPLVEPWLRGKDDATRNTAASYLGALGGEHYADTTKAILSALSSDPRAADVPWKGGALWLPGLPWQQAEARNLVAELAGWIVWCAEHKQDDQVQVIARNLYSISLARIAGYPMEQPNTGDLAVSLLATLRHAIGGERLAQILRQHDVADAPRYKSLAASR